MSSSTSSAPAEPAARRPSRGYYAIAHRAGNNLHELERALDAGVDAIECDFWHARGRLELRHERKLPGIPVLFDKWHLRIALGRLSLRRLLQEINFRAELFLDVKSSSPRAAASVLELRRDHASLMPRTLVCSRRWKLLDRLDRSGAPLPLYYSIGDRGGIGSLLRRVEAGERPAGTSIRHTLLSETTVRTLRDARLSVFAWTVNNRERARQLIDWGVDGIISDELDVLV